MASTEVAAISTRDARDSHGVDRFAARKQIVERLEEQGLVEKIEPHAHSVPHGDRSNVVIEPFLTDQWYVNAQELAKPAIAAVREGKTKFVPKNWENDLFQLDGKHPALVHLAPALVGPSDSGLVRADRRQRVFVADDSKSRTGLCCEQAAMAAKQALLRRQVEVALD